jgi:hypothetical protein
MDGPDIPEPIVERVRAICMALPETTERIDKWAFAYEIRKKPIAFLAAPADADGNPVTVIALKADPDERRALVETGHPYFAAGGGAGAAPRLGLVLDDATDWDELRELITDSYRLLAPKKLSALLDD